MDVKSEDECKSQESEEFVLDDETKANLAADFNFSGDQLDSINDVKAILRVFNSRGTDIVGPLLEVMADDGKKLVSKDLKKKQIFLEVILQRFAGRSLEHVSKGFEKVKEVLDKHYVGQEETQLMVIDTVFKSYGLSSIESQRFEEENLYMLRQKAVNLIDRLIDLGVVTVQTTFAWCVKQLEGYTGANPVELA